MTDRMTPTPEATEALGQALMRTAQARVAALSYDDEAEDILVALPEGTVLTTVDDVARRLCAASVRVEVHDWRDPCDSHRAEAKRLLGVEE